MPDKLKFGELPEALKQEAWVRVTWYSMGHTIDSGVYPMHWATSLLNYLSAKGYTTMCVPIPTANKKGLK